MPGNRAAAIKTILFIVLCLPCLNLKGGDRAVRNCRVTFQVNTVAINDARPVFITGSSREMGYWDPAIYPMMRTSDGSWMRTFSIPEGTYLEYKFTRGSWGSEAVDSLSMAYQNCSLRVMKDTIVKQSICNWADITGIKLTLGVRDDGRAGDAGILTWKYHPGDDMNWASGDFDDSKWEAAEALLWPGRFPKSGFHGIGWFRAHLIVDSLLWNRPLGMSFHQTGAAEVYIDGKLVYRAGRVSARPGQEIRYVDRNPQPVVFSPAPEHVIAVRYSCQDYEYFNSMDAEAGFEMAIGDLQGLIAIRSSDMRDASARQSIYTSVLLTLALMHLILFFVFPRLRLNLFFALFLCAGALMLFSYYQFPFTHSADEVLTCFRLQAPLRFIMLILGLLTLQSLLPGRAAVSMRIQLILSSAFALHGMVSTGELNYYFFIPMFVLGAYQVMSILVRIRKTRGMAAVTTAFIILCLSVIHDIFYNYGFRLFPELDRAVFIGISALSISLLLYSFGAVQRVNSAEIPETRRENEENVMYDQGL